METRATNVEGQSVAEWLAQELVTGWLCQCDPVPQITFGQSELLQQMIVKAIRPDPKILNRHKR